MLERKRQEGQLPVNVAAEKARLKRLLLAAQAGGDDRAVEASEWVGLVVVWGPGCLNVLAMERVDR